MSRLLQMTSTSSFLSDLEKERFVPTSYPYSHASTRDPMYQQRIYAANATTSGGMPQPQIATKSTYHSPGVILLARCCGLLFLLIAINIAILPFQRGAFQPDNPHFIFSNNTITGQEQEQNHHSQQRIVILGGPSGTFHNTATVQSHLLAWIQKPKQHQQWEFPMPTREEWRHIQSVVSSKNKTVETINASTTLDESFQPLYYTLSKKKHQQESSKLINIYSKLLERQWSQNKSLVLMYQGVLSPIGDSKSSNAHKNAPNTWQRLLGEVLPPKAPKQVVFAYRVPRVSHLIDLWRLNAKASSKPLGFKDYLKSSSFSNHDINSLDVLSQVERGLRLGLDVILVDTSGLYTGKSILANKNSHDDDARENDMLLSKAVACQVLQQVNACRDNQTANKTFTVQEKSKEGGVKIDLSQDRLNKLEAVLLQWDCTLFRSLLSSNKVIGKELVIYYSNSLKHCPQNHHHTRTHEDLVKSLRKIL